MLVKNLTPLEIHNTIEEIREKYNEYIKTYKKNDRLKNGFEARYVLALKQKLDISSFLLAELEAINELIIREEDRIIEKERLAEREKTEENLADKPKDKKERFSKYESMVVHPDASQEIKRIKKKCTHCGACTAVCPTKALYIQRPEMIVEFDQTKCSVCELCVLACPTRAMETRPTNKAFF